MNNLATMPHDEAVAQVGGLMRMVRSIGSGCDRRMIDLVELELSRTFGSWRALRGWLQRAKKAREYR
jgi:hypothetical protein